MAEAVREPSKRERAADVSAAREHCATCRCPVDGRDPGPLGPLELEAIDDVARLTGYRAPDTCPMACLYRDDVKRVALAKRYKLSPTVEPAPPAVLFPALAAMEDANAELLTWMREHPKKPPAAAQAPQGPVTDVRQFPLPKLQRR